MIDGLALIAAGGYTLFLMRAEKRRLERIRANALRRAADEAEAREIALRGEVERSWRLWENRCQREDRQLNAAMKKAWN